MWFRRITEITDVDPPPTPRVYVKRPPVEIVQFGQNAFQGLAFGPTPPSKFPPVSVKRKLDVVELAEDDIAHFKRIRLITTKERVRFIPGPFRQVQISGKDLPLAAAEKYEEEVSKVWEAFRTHEKPTGLSHPDTLISLRDLAQILRNVGKSSAAEEIVQTTLKELESLLVEKNPEYLGFLMASLMMALVDQKKLDAAEELWMRAVALFSKSVSAEENDALIRTFELAHPFRQISLSTTKAIGTAQESWLSNDRLLELFTTRRSPARRTNDPIPSTDPVPSSEGAPHSMVMGQLDAAKKPEVQVMETRKTKLGADHPDTLISMANLASTYCSQGRLKEAEELQATELEICSRVLGQEHPDTLHCMANLAFIWKENGRDIDALKLMKQCVEAKARILGANHPYTLSSSKTLLGWETE
jgi:tetratricopeptide (TPR) repeat protein